MSELDSQRDDLINDIDDALNMVRNINAIILTPGLTVPLSPTQGNTIIEWTFVHLHAEWEYFLENIFLNYMIGGQTDSGYAPNRFVFPVNETHALDLILSGRDFFQWTKPKSVNHQSSLCFENGEPFCAVLESSSNELNDITTIRNAIVHKSTVALNKFNTLVRLRLKTLPAGITPGIFLLSTKPKTIGTTFLRSYCNKLKTVAKDLVR